MRSKPGQVRSWRSDSLRDSGFEAPTACWQRTANVVHVTEPTRGGHFAPFEEPELYAEELRAFFRPYRTAMTG